MKKLLALFASLSILLLAACGVGDSAESDAKLADQKLNIDATNWAFDQEEYKIKAGEVSILLDNKDGMHSILISETGDEIAAGKAKTLDLEPGTYTMICNIICGAGHAEMKSTLIVE